TRLECRLDTLGTMIRIPQLSGYEDLLPCNPGSAASCSQRLAYLPLVAVSLGAIEVTEANRQRVPGRAHRGGRVGNQRAEPEYRQSPPSFAKWDLCCSETEGARHCDV